MASKLVNMKSRSIKTTIEFTQISPKCIMQIEIYAVLDNCSTSWFTNTHKQEIISMLLEKAKARTVEVEPNYGLGKKSKVISSFSLNYFTEPEVISGKTVKIAFSFQKNTTKYHSILTKQNLNANYESCSLFRDKLIVFSFPLTTTTSSFAASLIIDEKTLKQSDIIKLDTSERPSLNQQLPEFQSEGHSSKTSRDFSSPFIRSGLKSRPLVSAGQSSKKKLTNLSRFKFRRTKAIKILSRRLLSSVNVASRRRSRSLGGKVEDELLSCDDENLTNPDNVILLKRTREEGEEGQRREERSCKRKTQNPCITFNQKKLALSLDMPPTKKLCTKMNSLSWKGLHGDDEVERSTASKQMNSNTGIMPEIKTWLSASSDVRDDDVVDRTAFKEMNDVKRSAIIENLFPDTNSKSGRLATKKKRNIQRILAAMDNDLSSNSSLDGRGFGDKNTKQMCLLGPSTVKDDVGLPSLKKSLLHDKSESRTDEKSHFITESFTLSHGVIIKSRTGSKDLNIVEKLSSVHETVFIDDDVQLTDNVQTGLCKTRISSGNGLSKAPVEPEIIVIQEDDVNDDGTPSTRCAADLTTEQLRQFVSRNEAYLRDIFQGKIHCSRHEDYKKGGKRRKGLSWDFPVSVFTDDQHSQLLFLLKDIFCRKHDKYMDYLICVLLPEMLIKIFMELHRIEDHDEAEQQMRKLAMESNIFSQDSD